MHTADQLKWTFYQKQSVNANESEKYKVIAMIHHTFILWIFKATYVEETLQVTVVL